MLSEVLRALRPDRRELTAVPLSSAAPDAGRLPEAGQLSVFQLTGRMPSGWVELYVLIGGSGGGRVRLIAEGEDGALSMPLPLRRDGSTRTLVRLPALVRGLRIEIEHARPLQPPRVRVRELSPGEAAVRLAAPALTRRLREPWLLPLSFGKLVSTLGKGGVQAVADRLRRGEKRRSPRVWYEEWRREFDSLDDADRASIRARSVRLATRFSLLLPAYEASTQDLLRAIASLRAQLYPHWELCIAAAGPTADPGLGLREAAAGDPRIRIDFHGPDRNATAAANRALSLAGGDFVALLDAGDELREHALYLLAEELALHPDSDLLYADEDKVDEQGRFFDPHFKPDWNPDLLLSHDYVGHPRAFRRARAVELGGFRETPDGTPDYDLCLRVGGENRVHRVPFVLCHRRSIAGLPARPVPADAAVHAVQERLGPGGAIATPGPLPGSCRVRWPIPDPPPLASLIIPTRDGRALLETCVESLLRLTAYRSFEIIVVDNQSADPGALEYLTALEGRGAARVIRFDKPFNFSAINNLAVRQARGAVVGLLNNDLEVIDPSWLAEMVSHAIRPEIGAVGARLLYPDGTLQHGGMILGIASLAGHAHKHAPARDEGYFGRARLVQDVSAVTAACLLIRRETYLAVGGFDEKLAVAFNDVDFCLRVRASGLRNLWTPFATLVHRESRTRGPEDTRARRSRFHAERDRVLSRWGAALLDDPAYNPNLSLESEDFSLAWPPRVRRPWR
jgi:GT2 family glycosyltransferase